MVSFFAMGMKEKHVAFSTTEVFTFRRCLGFCAVPEHGGWPLGMEQIAQEHATIDVDTYETVKQERLKERLRRSGPSQDNDHRQDHSTTASVGYDEKVLETRVGTTDNPLYGQLTEDEREVWLMCDQEQESRILNCSETAEGTEVMLQPSIMIIEQSKMSTAPSHAFEVAL